MAQNSSIEWTHHTFNPWWGCQRVSPACEHCYAEKMAAHVGPNLARLWGRSHPGKLWGPTGNRMIVADSRWADPLRWNRRAEKAGERHRVFCASMADVFEDRRDLDMHRERLWDLISVTGNLDWLLLTKRPEHILSMVPAAWRSQLPTNVWMGTSVESQKYADTRIPILGTIPAVVRFISAEPLLGPIDLSAHASSVDWVITGGESGQGARGNNDTVGWYRDLRDWCATHRRSFFFKQWGCFRLEEGGLVRLGGKNEDRALDGREWNEFPTPRGE